MSKILIIGEKPSIARKIVDGLSLEEKFSKTDGYWESKSYVVSSCVGHLLKQMMPKDIDSKYAVWSLDNLPFNFKEIPLEVTKETKDQFNILKKLLKRDDISEVVDACDADREGELIFRNLIGFINPKNKTYSRMWIESVANNEIMQKQFKERKTQSLYDNLYYSAKARAYADYLLGLNSTQAMSVKYGNILSIGRVITPTLRIVVDLEKQINNFKSKPFYKLSCDTNSLEGFSYYNKDLDDNRFETENEVKELIKKIGKGNALITKFEKKVEKENAPKLFSLSDLQIECSRKYKYSAQQVLDACQSLYETHGLTTYPRTSENLISQEMEKECPNILKALKDYFTFETEDIYKHNYKINKSCVAKKDIASHEALTPTTKKVTESVFEQLSMIEKNVYLEIVKRFLCNFYPQAEYLVVNIEIERNEEKFTKRDKNLINLGFYKILDRELKDFNQIELNQGDSLEITEFHINEGKTEPPKRLTEGALIKIMQSPLKFVDSKEDKNILEESGGLGTEATRAGIIENMKKYGYIELVKNTIYATEKGISLIDIIPSERIKSVPLTVEFEKKLKLIKEGKYEKERFLKEIMNNVEEFVEDVKKVDVEETKLSSDTKDGEICKCPNCGSSIVQNKYGFGCSNWKNCKVQIYFNATERLGGKKINKTQAKELFTKGKTSKKAGFVSSKSGKKYDAFITYKFDTKAQYPNNINIEFD